MEIISEDMRLAVKRGATWMDENHAGWASRIDLDDLKMIKCDRCIVGQAVGSYYTVMENAAIADGRCPSEWNVWSNDHGFNLDIEDDIENLSGQAYWAEINRLQNVGYEKLESLWTDEVRSRLG